jgi:ABC-type sugar transport system substrate-binding protein
MPRAGRRVLFSPRRLGVVLLLASAACARTRPPTIGVSVATMQQEVYPFMRRAMLDRAAADGVRLTWVSAENSEAKQRADVEGLIAQGVDALILHAVNTATAGALVREAAAAGIPVIAMDRLPIGARVRLYVTADNRRVGRLQAEFLVKSLGGKGDVVILEGEAGNSVAQDITEGYLDVFAKHPGIKVVLQQSHKNWARDLARATTEDAYSRSRNKIRGIIANNSNMAMGALDAVESLHPAAAPVVIGADADRDACEAILSGRMAADVDKMPAEIGRTAYDAALRVIRREPLSSDATLDNAGAAVDVKLMPVRLITRDNVRKDMEYRWGTL